MKCSSTRYNNKSCLDIRCPRGREIIQRKYIPSDDLLFSKTDTCTMNQHTLNLLYEDGHHSTHIYIKRWRLTDFNWELNKRIWFCSVWYKLLDMSIDDIKEWVVVDSFANEEQVLMDKLIHG